MPNKKSVKMFFVSGVILILEMQVACALDTTP